MTEKKTTEKVTKIAAKPQKVSKYRRLIENLRARWNKKKRASKAWKIGLNVAELLALCAWVWVCLQISQYIVQGALSIMVHFGFNYAGHETVIQTVFSAIIYMICLGITIGLPWIILGEKTTRDECGLRGIFTWTDIGLGVGGFVVAMIAILLVTAVVAIICPWIDMEQAQDVGFENLAGFKDMMLAFVTLVVVAPLCEEIIFRGWLYGKLRARTWAMPAIILTSIMFGIAHGQWNVGITVGVMSVIMCLIREMTGTIWGGMIIHMLKNGLAYYLLFVRFI
jgi:membrane protease YdiL (CAAX protease family)